MIPRLDLAAERPRLVRLCARISGSPDAAEDLAQEALVEAHRALGRLRDATAARAWLDGIARNVCLRWARRAGRAPARLWTPADADGADTASADVESRPDDFDLEAELERHELGQLLDRALGLLPPETRAALVLRYVEESPHAEIAGRLAVSEGAVAMRLQRGRLALRRLLATELRGEAAAYGLVPDDAADQGAWRDTKIWCPGCGRNRLQTRFTDTAATAPSGTGWSSGGGEFWLQCPECHRPHGVPGWHSHLRQLPPPVRESASYAAVFAAVLEHGHRYYAAALSGAPTACWRCGHRVEVRHEAPPFVPPPFREMPQVSLFCLACGATSSSAVSGLVLGRPEGRRFWREQGRVRAWPEQAVEAAGRPAYRAVVESVASSRRLEVLIDRNTLEVIE